MAVDTMERLYTIREVAELIKADHSTVRRWVEKGAIEAVHVGPTKLVRIKESVLQKLLEPYPAEKNGR